VVWAINTKTAAPMEPPESSELEERKIGECLTDQL
jgi:hypothetical protein